MRPIVVNTFLLFVAVCLFGAQVANAQSGGDYELTWMSTGSGGEMTGGAYSLISTIGQPEAGTTQSGGGYSLNGGGMDAGSSVMTPASEQQMFLPVVWR